MIDYDFHSEAVAELKAPMDYYESRQPGLGRQFLDEITRAITHIRCFPEASSYISMRSRRCRISRFPYGLIYQIRDERIAILAVMHLHRGPGYWFEREA